MTRSKLLLIVLKPNSKAVCTQALYKEGAPGVGRPSNTQLSVYPKRQEDISQRARHIYTLMCIVADLWTFLTSDLLHVDNSVLVP